MVQDRKTVADLFDSPSKDGLYMVQDDTYCLAKLPDNYDEMLEQLLKRIHEKDAQRAKEASGK